MAQANAGRPVETVSLPTGQAGAPTPMPAPAQRVHAPDLRDTLHAIAPKAEAVHAPLDAARGKPAELPEDEIRSMLDIDDDIELDLS